MGRDWAPEQVQTSSAIVWLDDDHAVEFIEDTEGECGAVLYHRQDPPRDGFTFCAGSCYWRRPVTYRDKKTHWQEPPGAEWQLQSRDPLTLTPSILCGCGMHGWIQNGKWVSA